jgi:hypothetical protein
MLPRNSSRRTVPSGADGVRGVGALEPDVLGAHGDDGGGVDAELDALVRVERRIRCRPRCRRRNAAGAAAAGVGGHQLGPGRS